MTYCTRCAQALTGEKFCTACGEPVAVPPVVPTPGYPGTDSRVPLPPAGRSGRALPMLAAVVLLAVLGGIVVLIVQQRQPDATSAPFAARPSSSSPTSASPQGSPATVTPGVPSTPRPSPPPVVLPTPDAAVTTPFFTVVIGSKQHRADADRLVPRVQLTGYPPLVFHSSPYPSLRPGYWVISGGVFSSMAAARVAAIDLQRSFPDVRPVYPRCVGSTGDCAGLGG